MKKYLFFILFLFVSYAGFSQKGLSYQAVILDPNKIEVPGQDISGQPLINGDVWMKFSIFSGSNLQFEEVQKTKTDSYGLVNLMIGSVSSASFNSLVWDATQKNLQVFVSFNQGASYTKVSDQKLTYNPYSLFSETAGKLGGTLAISGGGTGATTAADARANLGLDQVNNTSDAAKPVSTATQAALNLKANKADLLAGLASKADTAEIKAYVNAKIGSNNSSFSNQSSSSTISSTALAAKADTAYVLAKFAAATIADADANSKGKIQLAGDLGGTATAPTVPGLALKANAADLATLTTAVNSVTTSITSEAATARAAELLLTNNVSANTASITTIVNTLNLKAPIASPTFTGIVSTGQINSGAISASSITAPVYSSTPITLTYSGSTINWDPSQGLNAEIVLTSNSELSFLTIPPVGSYGTVVLTQDGTGSRTISLPSINGVTNRVLGSTSTSTVSLSTGANSKDILSFYYDGTNCYWNIGQGYGSEKLSNSIDLASSVSGTLAVANGGTGATTLTGILKGNGTGALTAATAGTDYQAPITLTTTGSGQATLSGTTLNIPAVSSTVDAGSISGTIAVANGGTGSATKATAFDALSPMTTSGDIIYGSTSGTGTRLAKGTDGQVLQLASGLPTWQNGFNKNTEKVNFGANTGYTNQANLTTAVGPYAGQQNQSANATALGRNAGNSGQGSETVAVGNGAGATNQGNQAIAIGNGAGSTGQGLKSIAIGELAGATNQNANSIVLNATGTELNTTSVSSLYIAPIRSASNNNVLQYNTSTKEVTTSSFVAGTDYQSPITLTTTGTGAATLSGTTLNIPAVSSTVNAGSISGTVAVANGGTGLTTAPTNGQIDIGNGTGFTRATLTAGTAITITNNAGSISIAAAVRPTTDQFTAIGGQTSFTITQTPLNTKIWMFINGVRTNNNAYSVSGTTVTYTPANNNSYTIVVNDRIQFDYAY